MDPEGEMTLELFSHWDIKALQSYLERRVWNKIGNKETLVTRAFTAWELKVPVDASACRWLAKEQKIYDKNEWETTGFEVETVGFKN